MEEDSVVCTVRASRELWRNTFILSPDSWVREWTSMSGASEGRQVFPLNALSPRLNHRSDFAHRAHPYLRNAILFLGLAICLFFSDLSKQIPLLVPFLFIIGLPSLVTGLYRFRPHKWTVVDKKNGEPAVFIPHTRANREELAAFERHYVDTINRYLERNSQQGTQGDALQPPA